MRKGRKVCTGGLKTGGTPSGPGHPVWLGVVLLPGWRAGGPHLGAGVTGAGTLPGRREVLTEEAPGPNTAATSLLGRSHRGRRWEFNDLDGPEARTGLGEDPVDTARIQALNRLWESRRVPESW